MVRPEFREKFHAAQFSVKRAGGGGLRRRFPIRGEGRLGVWVGD